MHRTVAWATTALVVSAALAGCSTTTSPVQSGPASVPGTSLPTSMPPTASPASTSTPEPSMAPSASSGGLTETLQGGTWRIVSATGIPDVDRLSPVEFREALLVGTGVCGFASDVAFPGGAAIDIKELYWDAVVCKDDDPADSRGALKAILDSVTAAIVSADGSVVLTGPGGDVALSRQS